MTVENDTYRAAHAAADALHSTNVVASRLQRETAIRAAELARLASDPSRSNNSANTTQLAAVAAAEAAHKATVAASAKTRNGTLTAAWNTYRQSGGWQGYPGTPSMDAAAWQS